MSVHSHRMRRVFWRRRIVVVIILLACVVVGRSYAGALRGPGDGVAAKSAEWARDHRLGAIVTLAEEVQYRLHPPTTGGALSASSQQLLTGDHNGAAAATEAPSPAVRGKEVATQLPPIPSPVAHPARGEGVWRVVEGTPQHPLIEEAFVRPDRVHTSYLTGVAWMSRGVRFLWHPGYSDPGTAGFTQRDFVPRAEYGGLLATFNGGFKIKDARGGIFDHGHEVGSLVPGAASFVIFRDGHATVGTWGSDVTLTPDVVYVRQNLRPLVRKGALVDHLNSSIESRWGATLGGAYAVWRSGVGVTAKGDVIYACGDAMTVQDLADTLRRAGAVTAMQLDINRAWVSFMTYHDDAGTPVPAKLVNFERPAQRYLSPMSRDFFAVYAPRSPSPLLQ